MSVYFSSGFEINGTTDFTSATGDVQSGVKKFGSYAGRNENNENFIKTLDSEKSTIYIGGWFRWSVDLGTTWFVMLGEGSANTQFELRTLTGKHLKMWIPTSAGTGYAGTATLEKDTWYYIEVEFIVHDTTGSFSVKVDGVEDIAQSGIDTKNVDSGINTIKWQGINAAGYCYIDDVYVSDGWRTQYGIKVSRDGYSCTTWTPIDPTSIKNLALVSSVSLLKIKTATKVTLADTATTSIAHSLAYTPIVWVFLKDGSGDLVAVYNDTSGTYAYVDGTYLVIHNQDGASRDFYYYIFYDQI